MLIIKNIKIMNRYPTFESLNNPILESRVLNDEQFEVQVVPTTKSSKRICMQVQQPGGDDHLQECTILPQQPNPDDEKFQQQLYQSLLASKLMRNQQLHVLRTGEEPQMEEQVMNYEGMMASVIVVKGPERVTERENQELILQSQIFMAKPAPPAVLPVHREGILKKKSNKLFAGFKDCHCVLDNQMLVCYKSPLNRRVKCVLNFDMFNFSFAVTGQGEFTLTAFGEDMSFTFRGASEEWIRDIKQTLILRPKFFVKTFPRFWKKHLLKGVQYSEQAQSGDIVLFRGKALNCMLQRMLTGSDYDHVGLVLKYGSGKMYIMEATSQIGVGIFNWELMVSQGWYELYEKVVVRRLKCDRGSSFIDRLEKFVHINMGKQYKLSMSKIFRNESTFMDQSSSNNDRTFFCSELVAAAYKELGFLPKEKSSTQYWPGSFSNQGKDLELIGKASLSDEFLIAFNM